jgi:hypothetical protein
MKKVIVSLFILFIASNQVFAAIINPALEYDTYFYDTNTQYTWFDLAYFEGQSYNNVDALLKSNLQYNGFQIATLDQIKQLLSSTHEANGVESYYTKSYYSYLWDTMGGTMVPGRYGDYPILGGLFDFGLDEMSNLGWLYDYSNLGPNYAYNGLILEYKPGYDEPYITKDRGYNNLGVWVVNTLTAENPFVDPEPEPNVNPVPEPNTLLLFGAGLIGLAAFRRTRRS